MYLDKKILALIPARGGSKGIPKKNIQPIEGKPLVAYSIAAGLESSYIDSVVVTTDSEEIATISREYGADVPFLRPACLASDASKTIDCVVHAINALRDLGHNFDVLVLLQPTSPLRSASVIDGALEDFFRRGCKGLCSISLSTDPPQLLRYISPEGCLESVLSCSSTVRRQEMRPCYRVDGCIYINLISELTSETSLNDNPVGYVIPQEIAIDIDTPSDLDAARAAVKSRKSNEG